ncbi:14 kDa proline-rich protein DC2.15 [Linum grandiflorum]
MASSKTAALALFLALNLLFFSTSPATATVDTCSYDVTRLSICTDLLGYLLRIRIGTAPPSGPCCTLITGVADLEAAVCVCAALKANVLGPVLNLNVALTLLLNQCGRPVPSGFTCAY